MRLGGQFSAGANTHERTVVADRLEHPVPAELAHRIAGSGRVALCLGSLDSPANNRFRRIGSTGLG